MGRHKKLNDKGAASRVSQTAAAAALGCSTRLLMNWRKLGAPFAKDATVNVEELKAWASAKGVLGRPGGRPSVVDSLGIAETVAVVAAKLSGGSSPASSVVALQMPRAALGEPTLEGEEEITDEQAVEALLSGNRDVLLKLARVGGARMKRFALVGQTRKLLAEGEKRELDNRKMRGELCETAAVRAFWAEEQEGVKGWLQALPGKVSARLVGAPYEVIYQVLEDEVHALCESISKGLKVTG